MAKFIQKAVGTALTIADDTETAHAEVLLVDAKDIELYSVLNVTACVEADDKGADGTLTLALMYSIDGSSYTDLGDIVHTPVADGDTAVLRWQGTVSSWTALQSQFDAAFLTIADTTGGVLTNVTETSPLYFRVTSKWSTSDGDHTSTLRQFSVRIEDRGANSIQD